MNTCAGDPTSLAGDPAIVDPDSPASVPVPFNQQFSITDAGESSGAVIIKPRLASGALCVDGRNGNGGAQVPQRPCSPISSQTFRFVLPQVAGK